MIDVAIAILFLLSCIYVSPAAALAIHAKMKDKMATATRRCHEKMESIANDE